MLQMQYLEGDFFSSRKGNKFFGMDLHVYKVLKQQYNSPQPPPTSPSFY